MLAAALQPQPDGEPRPLALPPADGGDTAMALVPAGPAADGGEGGDRRRETQAVRQG